MLSISHVVADQGPTSAKRLHLVHALAVAAGVVQGQALPEPSDGLPMSDGGALPWISS